MSQFHPKPFGKYFLIDRLATGGMAEIYKAKTFGVDGFEKLLAIKRILPHCVADKEFIHMLIDEAKLSVLLSHTNIVQVYDLGKVGDDYFISMEYINGCNLRDMLNRAKEEGEKFPEDIVVYIVSEICKGLDYAHSKKDPEGNPLNIVHRDVSPQNILLSFEGEVKIVDFGIAKAAMNMSHTMAGILKGKISYMSPEQALGKPIDRKTDIFSAALMLYELLVGEKLFMGETQFEVLKKIRTTRLTENSFSESLSPTLRKILAKGLAYSVKDRYDNAGDFQIDLTRYLYSTYVDFTPRKLAQMMRKWFAQEIESKSKIKKDDLSIDAQTRSILVDPSAQQNIVHRETEEKTRGGEKQPTQTFIESFITGQEPAAPIPEITRTGQAFEEGQTPTPTPGPTAIPQPMVGKPKRKKPSLRWLAYPITTLLLVGAGLGIYYKTDLFKKPPPPPPKVLGELNITSNPEGAQIFLNNGETNLVTPATIKTLEVGESHTVTLKKPKFKDWTKSFTLADPNPVTFNPTLEVIPVGSIKVATQPPGAKIILNGQDTQKVSPTTLEELPLSQTYTLKLELDKHRPVEEKITVYSIEPIDFSKKLEEIQYGSVRVASNPSGARIYLNNSDTGVNTPANLSNLEVGKSYNIRLAKAGFRDSFRNIQMTDTRPLSLSEQLKKIDEKTPEQLAQEKLKEQQRQQELEKQKQAELEKQKEKIPEKLPETDRQKQAELEKQREAERQKQAELQKQKEKQKEAEKEKAPEKVGGDSYVALSTDPKGASVYINGVQRGSAPGKWKVAAGSPVEVKVSGDGCAPVTKVVTLRPGETRNLGTIKCGGSTPGGGPGVVLVDSNPPGAMVFLNGAPQKSTPLRIRGLRLSTTHTITVKKDGYETWSRSFTVEEGNQSFVANLKKL